MNHLANRRTGVKNGLRSNLAKFQNQFVLMEIQCDTSSANEGNHLYASLPQISIIAIKLLWTKVAHTDTHVHKENLLQRSTDRSGRWKMTSFSHIKLAVCGTIDLGKFLKRVSKPKMSRNEGIGRKEWIQRLIPNFMDGQSRLKSVNVPI